MKVKVQTYKNLEKYSRAFYEDDGDLILMFLVGDPGLAKTTVVRKVMKDAVFINAGSITAFKLYIDLYTNRDKIFVLDDCDQLWTDRASIRLLKSLCQTERLREIEWGTTTPQLDSRGVPHKFSTSSRVVIINNRWHTISQHVDSLEDRGIMIDFDPPVSEILAEGKKWFNDKEILKLVEDNLPYISKLSMRKLYLAKGLKKRGLEWKSHLLSDLGVSKLKMLEKLLKQPISDSERERRFEDETGLSRATFFNTKRELEKMKKPVKHTLHTVRF